MVSSELTYLKFLNKINKGNSQGDIACDRDRFVLIINEVKNRWVEQTIKVKDSILIDSLWEIVKTQNLINGVDKIDYTEFEIPVDFYELALSHCEADKEGCSKKLYLREVKNQDKNILNFNQNYRPDFDFEWSFVSVQDNKLRVYKNDFKVKTATIEYYQVIPDFDIEGYYDINGNLSSNKPFIISEQYVDQIINLAAEEFERNFQNPNNLTLAKDRTKSQE